MDKRHNNPADPFEPSAAEDLKHKIDAMDKGAPASFSADTNENPDEQIVWDEDKSYENAQDVYADQELAQKLKETNELEASRKNFKSRFNSWMRVVAIAIILAFVPEQACWAFNYNPAVLWGEKGTVPFSVDPDATPGEVISARIAASINHLLNQIAYKENTRVQLKLNNNAVSDPDLRYRDLFIDSNVFFNKDKIRDIASWLKEPNIHPLNCGVYALKDLLSSYDVDMNLEEISVATLMVDIMSNIIRPDDPKLKTSLFAISKVVDAFGINLHAIKIAPQDIDQLKTPFIANFTDEHFVTVTSIDADNVYYSDIGRATKLSKEEFIANMTGFVLAPPVSQSAELVSKPELVPGNMQAFIWGSKWHSNADDLPGLTGDDWGAIGIQLATTALGALLGPANTFMTFMVSFSFSLSVSNFASTIATVCILSGTCDEDTAMILSVAITAGLQLFGANMMNAYNAQIDAANAGKTATDVAKAGEVANQATQAATEVSEAANNALTSASSSLNAVGSFVGGLDAGYMAIATPIRNAFNTLLSPIYGISDGISNGIMAFRD